MSGGSPVGGGLVRQRYSFGSSSCSGSESDDLEDDACLRLSPCLPRGGRTWPDILDNGLWIASAFFITYFGDSRSNLIYLLWRNDRIRRAPLYFGIAGVALNFLIFLYTIMVTWKVGKSDEKWETMSTSTLPFATLLGIMSFCLFSFALWPVWNILTLPLLFTLFMAGMVIFPSLVFGTLRPQNDVLRVD